MSDVKMSEEFELPLVVVRGDEDHVFDIVTDEGDGSFVVHFADIHPIESAYHAAIAINSYDDNQELIAKLQADNEELLEKVSLLSDVVNHSKMHKILDWTICGISTNSSSGSEGRKSRMNDFYEFKICLDKALEETK